MAEELQTIDMNVIMLSDAREALFKIENFIKAQVDSIKVELPVTNHFAKDVYGRELFIPEGTLLSGKIHKHSSLNMLLKGKLILITEDGRQELEAPYVIASKPGIKRVIYALSDCTWVTCHGTDLTDVDAIEAKFIAKDYSEVEYLDEQIEQKKLLKE